MKFLENSRLDAQGVPGYAKVKDAIERGDFKAAQPLAKRRFKMKETTSLAQRWTSRPHSQHWEMALVASMLAASGALLFIAPHWAAPMLLASTCANLALSLLRRPKPQKLDAPRQ